MKNSQIYVKGVVDNDNRKWGENLEGIPIESPKILEGGEKNVLIAARNYADDICRQLEEIGNEKLEWISLEEIKEKLSQNAVDELDKNDMQE